jgi:hypothetical protein
MTGGVGGVPVTVASAGALYRRLLGLGESVPPLVSVHVAGEDAMVQVFAGGLGDVGAIEAVWSLAGLLDGRQSSRALVTDPGTCHFEVDAQLGALTVTVATVLMRPAAAAAA